MATSGRFVLDEYLPPLEASPCGPSDVSNGPTGSTETRVEALRSGPRPAAGHPPALDGDEAAAWELAATRGLAPIEAPLLALSTTRSPSPEEALTLNAQVTDFLNGAT